MRLLISGGGTGGGIYPALSIASALHQKHPDSVILWLGSPRPIDRDLVTRAGLDFHAVQGGPIVGVGLRAIPSAIKLGIGVLQSLIHCLRFKPDLLLMTGGWPALPATIACWLLRIPIVIYLPDLEPGSTIKAMARMAHTVITNFDESATYFPGRRTVAHGYPLRAELLETAGYTSLGERVENPPNLIRQAREQFELSEEKPTLLVFGGSKGTGSLNGIMIAHADDLLEVAHVIHITGRDHFDAVSAQIGDRVTAGYRIFPYLHTQEMALALALADLVVSRSGASTLGEFPLFEIPAILVPLAHAWRYQQVNADFLVLAGMAYRLDEDDLENAFAPTVLNLLQDTDQRQQMAEASRALRRTDASSQIVDTLTKIVQGE